MLWVQMKKKNTKTPLLYLSNGVMKNKYELIILGLILMIIVSVGNEYPPGPTSQKKQKPPGIKAAKDAGARTGRGLTVRVI